MGDGAGAGASINPVAFLVVQNGTARLLPIEHNSCVDRLIDYIPDLMEKINQIFNRGVQCQNEKTEKIVEQIRKNNEKNEKKTGCRNDFKEKDFEEKSSDKFELKHHISTDVNDELNYKIKAQEEESDGEDF